MRSLKSVVSAAAIALMLVVSIDYIAFAATGKSLILGKSNSANKVTKLTRTTSGPAMQFNVKGGTGAPIKVNSKGRVGKLNADMVDSKHASDLGVNTSIYTFNTDFASASTFSYTVPSVPAGSYLVTFDGWIYGPSGAELHCGVGNGHLWDRVPAIAGNIHFPLSSSGVVTKATTGDFVVTCFSDTTTGAWTDYDDVQITMTQITTPTVVARSTPKAPKTADPTAAR